ncbi:MAG: flagellar basal body-associated FliL family protein [Planctomycetes bacterium]|nr:flagellar basal body-associated FliL family protein [Planctomycetota bacterium]
MAENKEANKDAKAEGAEAPKKSKKGLMFGGGGALVVILGALAATMAKPEKKVERHLLRGPFVSNLSKNEITVNLAGEGSKRYLVMELNVEYFAYEESYVTARLGTGAVKGDAAGAPSGDPLYLAMLQDALLKIAARKTRDQVTDQVQIDTFLEEVRVAVDPLLFPVCVGDSHGQTMPDTVSGLRVGESIATATFRGMLHDHEIVVNALEKTVRLDDGPAVGYQGTERDLRVENPQKEYVFLDVTTLKPEFVGKVPIGLAGKVRQIYRKKFLVQ